MLLALESRILAEERNEKIAFELYTKTKKEYQRGIKDSGALSSSGEELSNINEKIFQVFTITRLDRIFDIFKTQESAQADFD